MSSLFVAEEPEQPEVHVKLEPDVEADMENIQIKQEQMEGDGIEKDDKQLGEGDVEMKYYDDEESDSEEEDPEDPIVDTIPIHLNAKVKDDSLAPLLLQFPNKSRNSHLAQNHISALHKLQLKPKSGVVELRLPLDTRNFFSETLSEKYNVSEQILRGVIIHDEPIGELSDGTVSSVSVVQPEEGANGSSSGSVKVKQEKKAMSSMSNNPVLNSLASIRTQPGSVGGSRYLVGVQDKEGRLHVTPLSDTCMLRPHFSYIDQSKMSKLERERELQRELNGEGGNNSSNSGNGKESSNGAEEEKKAKNVSVVTMSAKSTKENVPRLGGALLSAKLENEEEGKEFAIVPCDEEFIAKHFVETSNNVLRSKFTQREYLELLFEQTKL